jgi:hypothetical protein
MGAIPLITNKSVFFNSYFSAKQVQKQKQKPVKKVRFNHNFRLILIPSRAEYNQFRKDLWYSEYEMYKFKILEYGRQLDEVYASS